MQERHDSDVLPWVLTAAAVLIMAVAVRIGAGEPSAPQPQQQETLHSPEHAPAQA